MTTYGDNLFQYVKGTAQTKPAVAISANALSSLALTSLRDAADRLAGAELPIGDGRIAAIPRSISVNPKTLGSAIAAKGTQRVLAIGSNFDIELAIVTTDGTKTEFSRITFEIIAPSFGIGIAAPMITFDDPDFVCNGRLSVSTTRQDALDKSGLSEETVMRIEGALAYVTADRVVSDILGQIPPLDLNRILTAFRLSGEWSIFDDGENLLVVPAGGIEFLPNDKCPEVDTVGDLADVASGPVDQSNIANGEASWDFAPVGAAPTLPIPPLVSEAGYVSVYLPQLTLEQRFGGARPALPIEEGNNSFINWHVIGTVYLDYFKIEIDVARRSLLLTLELHGHANADISVKVPCVGNKKIARAESTLEASTVKVRYHFEAADLTRLVMRADIEDIALGKLAVEIEMFSKWLGFAGGEAFVKGLIIDVILQKIAAHNIPIAIRRSIKDEVNKHNMDLLNLKSLVQYTPGGLGFRAGTFHGDRDAVLLGLGVPG